MESLWKFESVHYKNCIVQVHAYCLCAAVYHITPSPTVFKL